jgi:ferredoxin
MHRTPEPEPSFHYVCTWDEARKIAEEHERFWVSNCGCREGGPGCKRSRLDVCLFFDDSEMTGTGGNFHEVDREFVMGLFREAEGKRLVTRPFHYAEDRTRNQGICFCCDDCCWYLTHLEEEACDRGRFVERTRMDACTHCGACVEVCYFRARVMDGELLKIARERCYGCGICRVACPEGCIEMVGRA